jgi:hypothetical protein
MNEAIDLAIKGGYDAHFDRPIGIKDLRTCVLRPEFWQALGKALGWDDGDHTDEGYAFSEYYWMWQYKAHKYFDLLLTGGETEKFWQDLLKQNNAPTETSRA